jgi:hypothetical protein
MTDQELFNLLKEKGVFLVKNGSVTLNFNRGTLKTIERKDFLYSERFDN